jgi:hypothetical protein
MRRTWTALAFSLLILIGGALLYAESSSTLTVKPSEMKNGETKTFTDDGRTITVRRNGDSTVVEIEGAGKTETLTITKEGGKIRIGRVGSDGTKSFVIGPDRNRIVIDGLDLDALETAPRFRGDRLQTFFVCPEDKTTLRVPKDKANDSYRCPVDGTLMEKKKGHGFQFFFDESTIEL